MNRNHARIRFDRRLLLKAGLGASVATTLGRFAIRPSAAQTDQAPHRFLQIFLAGGWDSALATDPVIGAKAQSGIYDPYYTAQEIRTVPGKDRLVVGGGLVPGLPAFQSVATAFVNGLWVEVTAHDLATQYLLTGIQSLTRSDDHPAFVARMGAASGRFPAHVVLGQVPLGETKVTAPPLQSLGVTGLRSMLMKPGQDWLNDRTRETMDKLTETLNGLRYGTEVATRSDVLAAWQAADREIPKLYAANFGAALDLDDAILSRYGAQGDLSIAGQLAGCYLLLKSNLSRFVTVTTGDFDTHSNHDPRQIHQLKEFSTALAALIADLRATPDPDAPKVSLMDTTTILITSEFVRTPNVNKAGGTDHWQSASAILMGKGVRNNVVVGATDEKANALGWDGGRGVPFNETTRIVPEQMASAILHHFGYPSAGDALSKVPLGGVFT